MNIFFSNLFSILINPPGNLVYYLLLIISIVGALQGTIAVMRSGPSSFAKRTVIGLIILIILQIISYLISLVAWSGLFETQMILAQVDRAFSLLCLIWIAWIWNFPKPAPKADVITIILSLLTIFLLGITITFWTQPLNPNGYNHTIQDNLWQILTLIFTLLALVVLVIRRPPGYGYGLAALALAAIGHMTHFFSINNFGYFSGIIRFSQMSMYPLLLALPRYISIQKPSETSRFSNAKVKLTFKEKRRFSASPKAFKSLFTLAAETDLVGPNITRAIAQSMMADLVFLILIDTDNNLNITCGFDLIREEVLDGTEVDKEAVPVLTKAILLGSPLRLSATDNPIDIQGLSHIIGLNSPGNVMSIPIETSRSESPIGAILLLSPYSKRVWSPDDQSYLTNISNSIVPILERNQRIVALSLERDYALSQVAELKEKTKAQVNENQINQDNLGKNKLLLEKIAVLSAELEEARNEIFQLQENNRSLFTSPAGNTSKPSEIELQFRMTLEELAHLQNDLSEANSKIAELEQRPDPSSTLPDEKMEVLASISQELRQPMSSIVGYIDLLLGESVGILGAMQRKFIERVKASTDRIGRLVDELIHITFFETGRTPINPEIIDLNLIIDNAVAYTSTQLREKYITLRLDIPESPPKIHIDREALQQILIHLLQNAGAATLMEGTVMLRVRFQEDEGKNYLMIQVVDSGGGIPAEDIPRVFTQHYRADNVLIQGLGDTGVGLAIAKTLTEAQSGRIWVETSMGVGSTITALLPIEFEQSEED